MWIGFIIASAFVLALYDLAKKASVNNNEVLRVLFCSAVAGFTVFTAALAITGRLGTIGLSGRDFALVSVKTLIVASSWVFTYLALRSLPITIATPIRATAPALTALIAAFIYAEIPSPIQGLGMLLALSGYLAFSAAGKFEGVDFLRNRAVWCAVAGMALSSAAALTDKFILQRAAIPQLAMQFWFQLELVVIYAAMIAGQRALGVKRTAFTWRWTIPLVGILLALSDWLYFSALAEPGVSVAMISIIRRVSVVFTFFLGARMFREHNLKRKTVALILILAGAALLILK